MLKLFLIRHGESVANTKGIYQGQSVDTVLSALGRRQAHLLAKRLTKEKIDTVFTSPLARAKETAAALSRGGRIEVIEDERLLEINHGKWEGKDKDAVRKNWGRLLTLWRTRPYRVQMPNGENLETVSRRVASFLSYLEKNYPDEALVIVGHDVGLRLMVTKALSLPDSKFWSFNLDNCSLTTLVVGSPLKISTLNETAHLRSRRSRLDRQAR